MSNPTEIKKKKHSNMENQNIQKNTLIILIRVSS